MATNKKPWWQSKTFLTGCTIVLLSAVEAINSGLSWREAVGMVLGSAVVAFRAVAKTELTK